MPRAVINHFSPLLVVLFIWIGVEACHSKKGNEDRKTILSDSGDFSELTEAINRHPDSAELYFERGKLSFQTADYASARKDIDKALRLKPLATGFLISLGQLYLDQQFPDSAIRYFKKALVIDPANKVAHLQLGFIYLNQKKFQLSLTQTQQILKYDPEFLQAIGLQSQAYEGLGDRKKALSSARMAYSLAPDNYDVLMRMGDLLLEEKDSQAVGYYKHASAVNPKSGEAFYALGLAYEQQGSAGEAMLAFNRAISNDPYFVSTYLHLGNQYLRVKDWEKAREIFNLAIKISPTNADAYFGRGVASAGLGKTEAARADYEQALVFDENEEQARKALEQLTEDK